jgi:hypothetical protein
MIFNVFIMIKNSKSVDFKRLTSLLTTICLKLEFQTFSCKTFLFKYTNNLKILKQ